MNYRKAPLPQQILDLILLHNLRVPPTPHSKVVCGLPHPQVPIFPHHHPRIRQTHLRIVQLHLHLNEVPLLLHHPRQGHIKVHPFHLLGFHLLLVPLHHHQAIGLRIPRHLRRMVHLILHLHPRAPLYRLLIAELILPPTHHLKAHPRSYIRAPHSPLLPEALHHLQTTGPLRILCPLHHQLHLHIIPMDHKARMPQVLITWAHILHLHHLRRIHPTLCPQLFRPSSSSPQALPHPPSRFRLPPKALILQLSAADYLFLPFLHPGARFQTVLHILQLLARLSIHHMAMINLLLL